MCFVSREGWLGCVEMDMEFVVVLAWNGRFFTRTPKDRPRTHDIKVTSADGFRSSSRSVYLVLEDRKLIVASPHP